MASKPREVTLNGFIRWMNLTDEHTDRIIELVSEGMPVRDAAREVGTSITQFQRLLRRQPELAERFQKAVEDGDDSLRHSLRSILFWHVFEGKEYKAARDMAIIYLPEWAALRNQRFEIGLTPEMLRAQAQEAFADLTDEEIEERIRRAEAALEASNVIELPQRVDGTAGS